jgi:hypothetical protein
MPISQLATLFTFCEKGVVRCNCSRYSIVAGVAVVAVAVCTRPHNSKSSSSSSSSMIVHIGDYSPSLRSQSLFSLRRGVRGECEKEEKAEASPFGWRCDRVKPCMYCTVQFLGESNLRLRDKHPSSQWKRSGRVWCRVPY